jgi:hypothetical protein
VVRTLAKGGKPVTVQLRQATYYLPLSPTAPGTLRFTAADSGTAAAPIVWQNYSGETPVVSGGIPVRGWRHASGSLWQVQMPAGTQPFASLFYNGERRLRARLQSPNGPGYYMRSGSCYSSVTKQAVDRSLCNLGTFLRVAKTVPPSGDHANCPSVARGADKSMSKCLDRFEYNPDDPIAAWTNLNPSGSICGGSSNAYPVGDVELTLFDAWTIDMMRIGCVDTTHHLIYLTAPTKGNTSVYNMFGPVPGHRYIVENTKDAFEAARAAGQTGLWFLDRSASPWTLNYLANAGEDPNRDTVVIPQVSHVSATGGSLFTATDLDYVTFRGITFEMDNYILPSTGFNNDENSDDTLPEALDCESCQHVTFDGITVRRTSASGLLIASTSGNSGRPAAQDTIENSAFYDIGDCGIRIGHHAYSTDKPENVVQFVMVRNNIVKGYSRVFASGEGISQFNGHDVTYSHNDITDGYHAALSVCALGCPGHAANGTDNFAEYNHIWDIMQGITSDGGTLYFHVGGQDGSGTGNRIFNNLVHDSTDSSIIDTGVMGAAFGAQGIYLDNNSAGIDVQNNVVYHVADSGIQMSEGPPPGHPGNRIHNNIFAYARKSMLQMLQPWWPGGCESEPKLRTSFTNNIFVFDRDDQQDFYVQQGCAYSCGLDYDKFQYFQGNLWWRTDGGFAGYDKAFHVVAKPPANPKNCVLPRNVAAANTFLTFAQWQGPKMNEDTEGTASVDPGFGKTGKPTDFLLTRNPVQGFDYTKTNDTIRHAGRSHPVIMPPQVPATFPTYRFQDW